MKRRRTPKIVCRLGLSAACMFVCLLLTSCGKPDVSSIPSSHRPPVIFPDYTNITIPLNIAPLNFAIEEEGSAYYVRISSQTEPAIELRSSSPSIDIPIKKWKKLLNANPEQDLQIDICVKDETGWRSFKKIKNHISGTPIDPCLVYRKINICVKWSYMGIFQRNLESYSENTLINNSGFSRGCMHCHTFRSNNPDQMLLQIRASEYGTPMLISTDNAVEAISTKTTFSHGKAGFTSWHPTSDLIAFSLNKYMMLYHTTATEVRDVFDKASDIALYDVETRTVSSTKALTTTNLMETMPEWSPDGKYLYFCQGPQVPPEDHASVQCNLMRIAFDSNTLEWGDLETVLSAEDVQGSITQPRFSPDGKFLLFTVSPYSDFPIHQEKSDLYLYHLETGNFNKLEASSERNDAWHGWSSNGRWITFNSKRIAGRFSRPHFSFIDEKGHASKAFVLPMKNPLQHKLTLLTYTMPELITGPVTQKQTAFFDALNTFRTAGSVDAISGATVKEYDDSRKSP